MRETATGNNGTLSLPDDLCDIKPEDVVYICEVAALGAGHVACTQIDLQDPMQDSPKI